jgi:uncharacterized protein (DUF433 family)
MPTEELLKRVTVDPQVCHGKPCIRGLRYPVTMLLELMSGGMSHEDILADYTDLERDDLLAALAYAARLSDARRIALA